MSYDIILKKLKHLKKREIDALNSKYKIFFDKEISPKIYERLFAKSLLPNIDALENMDSIRLTYTNQTSKISEAFGINFSLINQRQHFINWLKTEHKYPEVLIKNCLDDIEITLTFQLSEGDVKISQTIFLQ